MSSISQVLYIEETQDDGTKDWNFCVRYDGDSYLLYGHRVGFNLSTKMRFFNKNSLILFLTTVCCTKTSTFDITLYLVDYDKINNDNFEAYYNAYSTSSELVGYDNFSLTDNSLYDLLCVLRDTHVYY